MCNNWPNSPIGVWEAIGGLIADTAIICGGSYIDECYSLTSEKAKLVTHMSVGRYDAASIVHNDNSLWVTGGYNSGAYHASTEYVTMTGTMPGPDLPMALDGHAMVAISRVCSMVIGGYTNDLSAYTFFYDHNEGEWINGPSLMQAKYLHAAGIITDEVTDENFVAVTGGFGDFGFLESTEILQDGEWVEGKIIYTICYMNI